MVALVLPFPPSPDPSDLRLATYKRLAKVVAGIARNQAEYESIGYRLLELDTQTEALQSERESLQKQIRMLGRRGGGR